MIKVTTCRMKGFSSFFANFIRAYRTAVPSPLSPVKIMEHYGCVDLESYGQESTVVVRTYGRRGMSPY